MLKQVEIDQCPKCGGIWLDAGEFTRIYGEIKGAKVTSPLWATAMAEAAKIVGEKPATPGTAPHV
jgi:Zn-finger nucleic acid-binding protein